MRATVKLTPFMSYPGPRPPGRGKIHRNDVFPNKTGPQVSRWQASLYKAAAVPGGESYRELHFVSYIRPD